MHGYLIAVVSARTTTTWIRGPLGQKGSGNDTAAAIQSSLANDRMGISIRPNSSKLGATLFSNCLHFTL